MPEKNNILPTVSLIVPAYNAEDNICSLLESLISQDYPEELLEIIIVDNCSMDNTKALVRDFPVILLEENQIHSSYAARNKGIKHAKGEIFAFIDSDCIAKPQWVRKGIEKLMEESADLVGGKVEFYYSEKNTASEMYDSLTNMQVKYNIAERNVAKTANLFVKAFLFNKIGLFPDSVISGGDVWWTAKATGNGYKLVYAPDAIVKHPARTLKELLKKQYRVGKGKMKALNSESRSKNKKSLLQSLFPKLSDIKSLIDERGNEDMHKKVLEIWAVAYLCNLATVFGVLANTFEGTRKGK